MPHTPGPWRLSLRPVHLDPNDPHRIGAGISTIAEVSSCEDDARLIAAAPDLLAELQHVALILDGEPADIAQRLMDSAESIRATVAKAGA